MHAYEMPSVFPSTPILVLSAMVTLEITAKLESFVQAEKSPEPNIQNHSHMHILYCVQVLMLHKSVGADFYILMHKNNEKRNIWYHLTTEGTAEEFSKSFQR